MSLFVSGMFQKNRIDRVGGSPKIPRFKVPPREA
jgi:hypothetical protein